MRTIKFRGKPCYMGGKLPSWVYGTFQYIAQRRVKRGATDNGTLEPRVDKGRIIDIYGTETEVLCDTVGQFIGLRDGKGREIYEGDIIYSEFSDGSNVKLLVGWNEKESCFGLMDEYEYRSKQEGYDFPKFDSCELFNFRMDSKVFEVIGNIHDTPEQLTARTTI